MEGLNSLARYDPPAIKLEPQCIIEEGVPHDLGPALKQEIEFVKIEPHSHEYEIPPTRSVVEEVVNEIKPFNLKDDDIAPPEMVLLTRNLDEEVAIETDPLSLEGYVSLPIKEEMAIKKEITIHEHNIDFPTFTEKRNRSSGTLLAGKKNTTCEVITGDAGCSKELSSRSKTCFVERQHKCDICNKMFHHLDGLSKHMLTHAGAEEWPFKCDECGSLLSGKSALINHMRLHTRTNPREKHLKCTECKKMFLHVSLLTDHMRSHTGERPFKCNDCGQTFSRRANLTEHVKTHSDLKPFECEECGKVFRLMNHLKRHVKGHTEKKPFKCRDCGKRYAQVYSFTLHMKSHIEGGPFKCERCSKMFSQRSHLTDHMREHVGDTPFKCDECGGLFTLRASLTEHKRLHIRARLFKYDDRAP